MISVAMLGGGAGAAGYYLDRAADCDLPDYYTGEMEAPGRWCGNGAAMLGLDGAVTGDAARVFAGLLEGRLADGSVVAKPVWRSDERGQLAAEPLVRELRRTASACDVEVAQLFTDPQLAGTATALVTRVETARPSQRHTVRVDARRIGELALAAGINPHVLYPGTRRQRGYAAALQYAGAKTDARRCGLDVVVSAPKSVSVLFGLADPTIAKTVASAHEHAVSEALGYLERHTSHGLRGHQGDGQRATHVNTRGFVAGAFTHHTSRADDPQLHTHLVIANLVHGEDGKWTAVDSRAVHRHARTAGYLYQAVLRGELTRTLGVEWGPVRKGVAELVAIPEPLRRLFSTRRVAIEAELDRTGMTGRRAAQRAAYRTRPAKTHTPERSLREVWRDKAVELLHVDPRDLLAGALHAVRPPTMPEQTELTLRLLGPDGLTAKATSFDRRDVLQAFTETIPTGLPVTIAELETTADALLRDADAVPLLRPAADTGERRWTTVELLEVEAAALARSGDASGVQPVAPEIVAHAVDALGGEQRELVTGLLDSPRGVDVIVGPAGSGKTATLRAAHAAWHDNGTPVLGCAVAAVTARRLEAATGITSCSVAKLLADLDTQKAALPTGGVVVVDEASMVGTRDLHRLLTHTHRSLGKLVLVGDPAQLPEIDAGGLFAALAAHATPLRLTANQRQEHSWEARALLDLRDGRIDTAIDAYVAHRRVHVLPSVELTQSQIAHQYVERLNAGAAPGDVVVLASTRDDATALNDVIRQRLWLHGRLDGDRVSVGTGDCERQYAAGDLVLVTRNDHQRGLLNGTRATLTHVSDTELTLRSSDGTTTTVPTGWAVEHLDHGYAMTVHKAQGLTCQTTFVYGTAALCQQAGYVALSRGTTDNHLYTANPLLTPELPGVHVDDEPSRFRLLTMTSPEAVLNSLAERLTITHQHRLASSQQPAYSRADDEHHGRWHDQHYGPDIGLSR